jgi:hypothetical protein
LQWLADAAKVALKSAQKVLTINVSANQSAKRTTNATKKLALVVLQLLTKSLKVLFSSARGLFGGPSIGWFVC